MAAAEVSRSPEDVRDLIHVDESRPLLKSGPSCLFHHACLKVLPLVIGAHILSQHLRWQHLFRIRGAALLLLFLTGPWVSRSRDLPVPHDELLQFEFASAKE